jgi:hypothetical protein
MQKVHNDPGNYLKRSHIVAPNVAEQEAELRKRTAANFSDALIDDSFYVSFRSASQKEA